MAGIVHIPWYATSFRGDALADALERIAAVSLHYGATDYRVYRHRDDRYRFIQTVTFGSELEWERYWEGEEFISFRINHQGWYQVPILYAWTDLIASGGVQPEPIYGEEVAAETGEHG
jgi:hypothetical protein